LYLEICVFSKISYTPSYPTILVWVRVYLKALGPQEKENPTPNLNENITLHFKKQGAKQ